MSLLQVNLSVYIEKFMEHCRKKKHWNTFDEQGLVETESGYHKFIWLQDPARETFKNAVKSPLSITLGGTSYKTVRNTFVATVSLRPISAATMLFFEENPTLQSWVAMYDLNTKRPNEYCRLNLTQSEVFQEFETFLNHTYGLKPKPFPMLSTTNSLLQVSDLTQSRQKPNFFRKLLTTRVFPNFRADISNELSNQTNSSTFNYAASKNYYAEPSYYNSMAINYARVRPVIT